MKLIILFFTMGIITFVTTFIIFSLIRTNFFKKSKKNSSAKREFFLSIFIAYLFVLCLFLFIPNVFIANHGISLSSQNFDFVGDFKDRMAAGYWGVNIIPLKTIKSYINYSGVFHIIINIVGNILIFVPFGFFLPLVYKDMRKIYKLVLTAIAFSLFVEIIQFFVGRSVDIDDLILNVVGAILGYAIFFLLEKN